MKVQSLRTHHHADGKSGFVVHKTTEGEKQNPALLNPSGLRRPPSTSAV